MALLFIGSAIAAIVIGGVAHFGEAIASEEVLFSLRMSVVTSTISTVLCLLLALPTAYALSHVDMPFKRVAEVLMELTLSLPYILLGFALLLIFSSPFGKALRECGFAVVFEPTGIVFAQLIVNLPFAIRMVRTAFADVNPRMEFVAKTLGAMPFDVFRTIIVPQCRNSDHFHIRAYVGARYGRVRRHIDARGRDAHENRNAARQYLPEHFHGQQ